jgi:hypothetical protein
MAERLKGMAEGAEIPPGALYLLNSMEAAMSSLKNYTEDPSLMACSALALRSPLSGIGEPVITRNFDYLPLVQPFFIFRETKPEGELSSLDFTMGPLAGAVDGINAAGLVITYNYAFALDTGDIYQQARAGKAAPLSMLISEALGRCSTVTEAAEWIAARPRWGSGLLMLADAQGEMASLEISSTRAFLRRAARGENVLYHTNCYHSEIMREVELSPDAVFSQRAAAGLRGRRVLGSSFGRNKRISQLLSLKKQFSPDDLAGILADHGDEQSGEPSALCVHGPTQCTTAILQYFPVTRRVRAAFTSACQARFSELNLNF